MTVLTYAAEGHMTAQEKQETPEESCEAKAMTLICVFFSCPTCSVSHVHLSGPRVDQDPLSGSRGAAQDGLSQQGGVPGNGQRVESCTQALLGARLVPLVDLVQDPLRDTIT